MNHFSLITYNTTYPKTRRCLMEFLFLFQSYIFLTFAKFAQKNVLVCHKIKTKQIPDSKFVDTDNYRINLKSFGNTKTMLYLTESQNSACLQAIFNRTLSQISFLTSFTGSYTSHCKITRQYCKYITIVILIFFRLRILGETLKQWISRGKSNIII